MSSILPLVPSPCRQIQTLHSCAYRFGTQTGGRGFRIVVCGRLVNHPARLPSGLCGILPVTGLHQHHHYTVNLISSITICYAATTAKDKCGLQPIIHSTQKVIRCNLPPCDLCTSRTVRCAGKITASPFQPSHGLFVSPLSGRRLRPIETRTSRHKKSFFLTATVLVNSS